MRWALISILLVVIITGCTVGRGSSVLPDSANTAAQPSLGNNDSGRDCSLLVANSLSETISRVDRKNGKWTVTQNILPTGQAPNQLTMRDGLCYVVNSLSNSIEIIDPVAMTILREISTGKGTNPVFMDFIDSDTAFVTCYLSNEVFLIDLRAETDSENRIIAGIAMPSPPELPHDPGISTQARPGGIAITSGFAYVACSNLKMYHVAGGPGVLVEIDISDREISGIYELSGRDTISVLHSPRFPDRLIIASAGSYEIADGFVGDGKVESFNLESKGLFQAVAVDGAPFGCVVGPDDILFLENGKEGSVLRVDLHAGIELDHFRLPDYGAPMTYASSLAVDSGILLATDFNTDRLYIIEPDTGSILGELATGDGPDAMVWLGN
jgi:hypothetical protein